MLSFYQHEPSKKSDVPGFNVSALNPFKYSKEFMIKLYKPVGLPLEFEWHEYITSKELLQPMTLIIPTEQEQKVSN
ncbi:gyf domain protein [Gigaspora margarita]|uniref:Gyf domain protein n=1 Tax=Gigaspora margarita TaxID=4874 RepID=A0A8H4AI61_GIGMA|nr:gyf domain protein [Gigaspora margarita]